MQNSAQPIILKIQEQTENRINITAQATWAFNNDGTLQTGCGAVIYNKNIDPISFKLEGEPTPISIEGGTAAAIIQAI